MDGRTPRQQRHRTPRGPPTPHQSRHTGRNPNLHYTIIGSGPPADHSFAGGNGPYAVRLTSPRPVSPRSAAAMEDDAITTLMDIDDSPRSAAGAGFLDDDDEGDLLHAHRMGGRANEARGPLAFSGFFNTFDGADFDDSDLA